MSRGIWLLGVGITLVTLALVVTDHALAPPPGVTEDNLHRIQKGMTLRQVEGLFGGPADVQLPGVQLGTNNKWQTRSWSGPAGEVSVWFTQGGRVDMVFRSEGRDVDGTEVQRKDPLGPLRAVLGW